jgi:hypothetical protein
MIDGVCSDGIILGFKKVFLNKAKPNAGKNLMLKCYLIIVHCSVD